MQRERVKSAKTIDVKRRCRLQTWFLACSSRCDRGRWPFIHQMSVQSAAQTARKAVQTARKLMMMMMMMMMMLMRMMMMSC